MTSLWPYNCRIGLNVRCEKRARASLVRAKIMAALTLPLQVRIIPLYWKLALSHGHGSAEEVNCLMRRFVCRLRTTGYNKSKWICVWDRNGFTGCRLDASRQTKRRLSFNRAASSCGEPFREFQSCRRRNFGGGLGVFVRVHVDVANESLPVMSRVAQASDRNIPSYGVDGGSAGSVDLASVISRSPTTNTADGRGRSPSRRWGCVFPWRGGIVCGGPSAAASKLSTSLLRWCLLARSFAFMKSTIVTTCTLAARNSTGQTPVAKCQSEICPERRRDERSQDGARVLNGQRQEEKEQEGRDVQVGRDLTVTKRKADW